MQGESDANNEEVANKYYNNLKKLMDLMCAKFRNNELPIVIGKISDYIDDKNDKVWDFSE
jgi:Carbohydrate esterase, sialic acid-specific acetylesterase